MSGELDRALRVSDAERERAVSELEQHFAAGRLDHGELAERTAAVYRARTRGALDAAASDLPAPAWSPPLGFREHALAFVAVNAVLLGLWSATRDPSPGPTDAGAGYYWPLWVLAIWAIVLTGHAFLARRSVHGGLPPAG